MTQIDSEPSPNAMTIVTTGIESMLDALPIQPGRIVTKRILKANGARLVLMALDAGQELTEHTAAVPILIQVVAGRASVSADGGDVELSPGGMVHIAQRAPHAVLAHESSHVLLTLLDS